MKILIIGAGPAGSSCAYFLKNMGHEIDIVEKEQYVGGCSRTNFLFNIPYEFGPQIMYASEKKIQDVFETFLHQNKPNTFDGEYHPSVSLDGKIDKIYDFPITISNVLKYEKPEKIIKELYNINLDNPDYSNFENYIISRIGKTLYELYFKNYNIKQWKIHPKDMDAEWAKFKTFTLREKADVFCGKWQGHPGNYNPMWENMTSECNIIKGESKISDDFKNIFINNDKVEYDLVFSSLPLSENLDFINTYIIYVVLKSNKEVMPSYTTSFPNNYDFVRIIEFKQQFYVESDYTILDFEFPWTGECFESEYHEQVKYFCEIILKKEIVDKWVWNKEKTYPVSTGRNLELVKEQIEKISSSKVVPIGRSGVHAYVSKDTCIKMSMIAAENFDVLIDGSKSDKKNIIQKMREKLS